MNITITSRKVTLKDSFKNLVEKKLSRFSRVFSEDANAKVTVSLERDRETVEITINDRGMIYRAESTSHDMNEALDDVVNALKRQMRKHKTKLSKKLKSASILELIAEEDAQGSDELDDIKEDEYEVVRSKHFPIKPLDVEEAILEMNMIGHKFYMFRNFETNKVNVVYVRKDGRYGLLEPDAE